MLEVSVGCHSGKLNECNKKAPLSRSLAKNGSTSYVIFMLVKFACRFDYFHGKNVPFKNRVELPVFHFFTHTSTGLEGRYMLIICG